MYSGICNPHSSEDNSCLKDGKNAIGANDNKSEDGSAHGNQDSDCGGMLFLIKKYINQHMFVVLCTSCIFGERVATLYN